MISTFRTANTIRRAILVFVPAAVLTLVVTFLLFRAQDQASRSIALANEEKVVELGRQRIVSQLAAVISDLQYLGGQAALQRLLSTADPAARRELAAEYVTFATYKTIYDQIRFIDADGREVVRVNWNGGRPSAVPEPELQIKVDRYYVHETLKLDPGGVYVSPLDLNVEHGAIEQPIKPMIRFGAPVFDREGRKRGVIVTSYLGQRILDRVAQLAEVETRQLWLVNEAGYWLHGPSPADEWGFMYPDRQDRSFARAYPEIWQQIRDGGERGQSRAGGDVFTFGTVSPESRLGEAAGTLVVPSWYLVAHLPAAGLAERSSGLARNLALSVAALLALLAVGAWFVARHWTARQLSEESLRHGEFRFRSLLDSAPDAVVITDAGGKITLANAQAERLFGYGREELIGQPVEILLPDQYRSRHIGHRAGYVAAPRPRAMGAGLKLVARRRDGSEVPVAISLSPSQTAEGIQVFCDIRDITREREIEQQMEELNERLVRDNAELESLNKELEAFSYSVSHDLRAPLRAIDGFSQALLEDCSDRLDAQGRNHLDRVRNAAQRMGHLIDDLLKLARVTRAEVSPDEIDMGALAHDVVRALQSAEPERKVEIRIAEHLRARADPRLLRIALENLIGNAWKFTSGKDPARIELGANSQNGEPAYFVRDNGVGFDMAYAGRLFGAFQRLHNEPRFPGTGIGLATAQRIIRRHGGRIWAESEIDKGTTFYFTI